MRLSRVWCRISPAPPRSRPRIRPQPLPAAPASSFEAGRGSPFSSAASDCLHFIRTRHSSSRIFGSSVAPSARPCLAPWRLLGRAGQGQTDSRSATHSIAGSASSSLPRGRTLTAARTHITHTHAHAHNTSPGQAPAARPHNSAGRNIRMFRVIGSGRAYGCAPLWIIAQHGCFPANQTFPGVAEPRGPRPSAGFPPPRQSSEAPGPPGPPPSWAGS